MRASSASIAAIRHPALINWVQLGALVAILLSYIVLLTVKPATARLWALEDGPIEDLGAAFSLIACYLFLFCYFRSTGEAHRFFGRETKRNVWFLALAVLMFVSFGEEISWGQRVFGWSTPAVLDALNAQGETNLHNFWLIQATNPDGTRKSSLQLLLNANRLYSIFWLSYCVVLPVLAMSWERLARLTAFFGVPIPPLAAGGLFLANYAVFLLIIALGTFDKATVSAFDELKETNYAFAYVVFALSFLALLPVVSRRAQRSAAVRG